MNLQRLARAGVHVLVARGGPQRAEGLAEVLVVDRLVEPPLQVGAIRGHVERRGTRRAGVDEARRVDTTVRRRLLGQHVVEDRAAIRPAHGRDDAGAAEPSAAQVCHCKPHIVVGAAIGREEARRGHGRRAAGAHVEHRNLPPSLRRSGCHRAHVGVLGAAAQARGEEQQWACWVDGRRHRHEGCVALLLLGSWEGAAREEAARCRPAACVAVGLVPAPDARQQVDRQRAAVRRAHEIAVIPHRSCLPQLGRQNRVHVAIGEEGWMLIPILPRCKLSVWMRACEIAYVKHLSQKGYAHRFVA